MNVPFSLIVPVVGSTELSTNVSVPVCSGAPGSSCGFDRTGSLAPSPIYRLIAASCASGTEKVT